MRWLCAILINSRTNATKSVDICKPFKNLSKRYFAKNTKTGSFVLVNPMREEVEKLIVRFVLQESQSDLRGREYRSSETALAKRWSFALCSAARFPTSSTRKHGAKCQRLRNTSVRGRGDEDGEGRKRNMRLFRFRGGAPRYALWCSEREGCGSRAASEFQSTDVRQFGPN